MNPLQAVRQLWADKKKRPWIVGATGATVGLGIMAARRPVDPAEAAAEDAAVENEGAPSSVESPGTYADPNSGLSGAMPVVVGSGYGTPDPAFMEADLGGVYAAIDEVAATQIATIDEAVARETSNLRAKVRNQKQEIRDNRRKDVQQQKAIKKGKQQVKRLRRRVHRVEERVPGRGGKPRRSPKKKKAGRR